jgi:signal transduction histidine kinase/FixJ family two-component response regulator
LSASVALIALFAVIGYMLGVAPLYTLSPLRPMAIHTAIGIFISAMCLAGLQRRGLVAILWDRGPAGSMARSVLPIAVLIPVAIGGARLWGQQAGLYGTEAGVSIQVVANVILTCALLAFAIFKIHRTDKGRLEREAALKRSQEFAQVGHVQWSEPDPQPVWSGEAIRILGLTAGSTTPGLSAWTEIVDDQDRDGFREYLATARRTGLDAEWCGRIVRANDGKTRQVRVYLATDDAEKAGDSSLFGIIADVTDLERARRHAEHAARAKGAFLANMSHEIRTPLNGVLGFSELLVNAELGEENHEHAKLVHQSAEALLHLLNDILDFSKIEAGSMEVAPEPTCLPELLQDCVSLIEPAARAKGVAVFLHLHEGVPTCAMVDGLRLRQIALNVLGNAVKFTDKGFIALEALRHEGGGEARLVVRIHDTGVGVPVDRQEAIFGEFVQADPTVARSFGGTGLGLSISRRLAELMGGALTLRSEPGRGTKVELNLPLVAVEKVELGDETPLPSSGVHSARILLVEDDPLNQILATTVLNKLGHQVELAVDGVDAVQKMEKFELGEAEFDLVLMDIQLPKLDGMAATVQMRSMGPRAKSIPIIGLSANAYASDVAACLEAGMDDHVPKPFSTATLARAVARWTQPDPKPAAGSVSPEIVSSLVPMFLEQCGQTQALVVELKQALDGGSGPRLTQLASEVKQASHKLAGTAASFGRTELGRAAVEAEQCLTAFTATSERTLVSMRVSALSAELTATSDQLSSKAA